MTRSKLPVTIRLAGFFHFVWAALFGLIVAIQFLDAALRADGGQFTLALWNLIVVFAYAAIGWGCWKVRPTAYRWGLNSNALNLGMHLMAPVYTKFGMVFMSLEAINVALLYRSREMFKEAPLEAPAGIAPCEPLPPPREAPIVRIGGPICGLVSLLLVINCLTGFLPRIAGLFSSTTPARRTLLEMGTALAEHDAQGALDRMEALSLLNGIVPRGATPQELDAVCWVHGLEARRAGTLSVQANEVRTHLREALMEYVATGEWRGCPRADRRYRYSIFAVFGCLAWDVNREGTPWIDDEETNPVYRTFIGNAGRDMFPVDLEISLRSGRARFAGMRAEKWRAVMLDLYKRR